MQYIEEEGHALHLRSRGLNRMLYSLDDYIDRIETENESLKAKLKESEDKYWTEMDRQHKASWSNMGEVLKAIVSVPKISSIGPVGATIIAKIGDMQNMKQVKAYLKTLSEAAAEEDELKGELQTV